jgi:hypothetical protein
MVKPDQLSLMSLMSRHEPRFCNLAMNVTVKVEKMDNITSFG